MLNAVALIESDGMPSAELRERWRSVRETGLSQAERVVVSLPLEPHEATKMWAFGSPFPFSSVLEIAVQHGSDLEPTRRQAEALVASTLEMEAREVQMKWLPTTEFVVIDGDTRTGGSFVKAMFFPHRLPHMTVADFQAYWRTKHAAIVPKTPHLYRYVQCHPTAVAYDQLGGAFSDGIAELWWRSLDDAHEALASAAFTEEQPKDAANFVDPAFQTGTLVSECRLL
jgi:uncharacterized protein (TIGR02118 family)